MELDLIVGQKMPKTGLTELATSQKEHVTDGETLAFSTFVVPRPPQENTPEASQPDILAVLPLTMPSPNPSATLGRPITEAALTTMGEVQTPEGSEPVLETSTTPDVSPRLFEKPTPDTEVADAPSTISASPLFTPIAATVAPPIPEPTEPTVLPTSVFAATAIKTSLPMAKNLPNDAKPPVFAQEKTDRAVSTPLLPALNGKAAEAAATQIAHAIPAENPLWVEARPKAEPAPIMGLPTQVKTETTSPHPVTKLAPVIGPKAMESMDETQAELQFGLKIEQQSIGSIQATRPAPQAAPVANQISSQIPHLISKAEKQTIELRLDPPELGRVTIHLTTHDQHVTAQVVADRVDTVDLMRRHAEVLTATLARAGFSQADLSFEQGSSQGDQNSNQQFQFTTGITESDEVTLALPTLTGIDGRLDIRL